MLDIFFAGMAHLDGELLVRLPHLRFFKAALLKIINCNLLVKFRRYSLAKNHCFAPFSDGDSLEVFLCSRDSDILRKRKGRITFFTEKEIYEGSKVCSNV